MDMSGHTAKSAADAIKHSLKKLEKAGLNLDLVTVIPSGVTGDAGGGAAYWAMPLPLLIAKCMVSTIVCRPSHFLTRSSTLSHQDAQGLHQKLDINLLPRCNSQTEHTQEKRTLRIRNELYAFIGSEQSRQSTKDKKELVNKVKTGVKKTRN
eukprot:scaffold25617_cov73-Skeletonema_marinoi.AAC.1